MECLANVFQKGRGPLTPTTAHAGPRRSTRRGPSAPTTGTRNRLTIACVPLLALSPGLLGAGLLYNGERFGKAVRTPARDTMLAHASVKHGTRLGVRPVRGHRPIRFWLYAAFSAATMLGFATWAVLADHLTTQGVLPTDLVPVLYAAAMGAAALSALAFGRIYDRVGLRSLVVLPVLTAAVPFLSFTRTIALVILGAVVWGAAMGAHESTLRAAVADLVADLVPAHRRGGGYGTFTAIFVLVTQTLALLLLIPLLATRTKLTP